LIRKPLCSMTGIFFTSMHHLLTLYLNKSHDIRQEKLNAGSCDLITGSVESCQDQAFCRNLEKKTGRTT
jgi:hypothetical protein